MKGLKTSGIVAPVVQVANPEEIITNAITSLVAGLIHSAFNWFKHRKK